MTWIILEGLDRTGKSTVAETYRAKGFEVVHMSAPDKKYTKPGYVGPSYLDDMMEMLISYSGRNVVFDRSIYGELVWSYVYGRKPLLDEDEISLLREIEQSNDASYYLLYDPDIQAHWKRCVDNNEPLTPSQFNSAATLFDGLVDKYNFQKVTMYDLLGQKDGKDEQIQNPSTGGVSVDPVPAKDSSVDCGAERATDEKGLAKNRLDRPVDEVERKLEMTPEQKRLAEANAINDILSNRIIKKKGELYDAVESKMRDFLNKELALLIGMNNPQEHVSFTDEEIVFLKTLIKQAKKTK